MKEIILCILKGECFAEEASWLVSFIVALIVRWIEKGKNKQRIAKKISSRFNITEVEAKAIIKNHTPKKNV